MPKLDIEIKRSRLTMCTQRLRSQVSFSHFLNENSIIKRVLNNNTILRAFKKSVNSIWDGVYNILCCVDNLYLYLLINQSINPSIYLSIYLSLKRAIFYHQYLCSCSIRYSLFSEHVSRHRI